MLAFISLLTLSLELPRKPASKAGPIAHDAQTIISGRKTFRLADVEAPALDDECEDRGASYLCGREAQEFTQRIISGGPLICSRDRKEVSRYRCTVGGQDLALALVQAGYGFVIENTNGPYDRAQRQARISKAGLWRGGFLNRAVTRLPLARMSIVKIIGSKPRR